MGAIDYLALLEKIEKNTPDAECTKCTKDFTHFMQSRDLAQKADFLPAEAQAVTPAGKAFDAEAFEERAAIMEFDGGLSRAEAERLALAADTLPDPAAEARRKRVLAMLAERPGIRYAVLTDSQADPAAVILAIAIRGALTNGGTVTCELEIPRTKYDGVLLLDLLERRGATVH